MLDIPCSDIVLVDSRRFGSEISVVSVAFLGEAAASTWCFTCDGIGHQFFVSFSRLVVGPGNWTDPTLQAEVTKYSKTKINLSSICI